MAKANASYRDKVVQVFDGVYLTLTPQEAMTLVAISRLVGGLGPRMHIESIAAEIKRALPQELVWKCGRDCEYQGIRGGIHMGDFEKCPHLNPAVSLEEEF